MRLGIIGRNWGSVYARSCEKLGIDYWISGREWGESADGYIIATPPETHYAIASELLSRDRPVIVEKPVTMDPRQARELANGRIAFAGHTRLYDPNWKRFKASVSRPFYVEARAGGTDRDPWWDWGPHIVSMCLDLGYDPRRAQISVRKAKERFSFKVNGKCFVDSKVSPSPIECLLSEFTDAIKSGLSDNRIMPEVVEILHELG